MNYTRDALGEHDQSVREALSNIDQDTITKTKEILNSKEFKNSYGFKKHCQPYFEQAKKKKLSQFKKFVREHCLELISIFVAIVFGILALIFK